MSHEEEVAASNHVEKMVELRAIYEMLKLILDAVTVERKNFAATAEIRTKGGLDP